MKNVCALLRIKFFSQQDDTIIVNFNENVLILWPFFWGNVIFKICPSISKVTIYVPKFFHCVASPVNCQLLLCKAMELQGMDFRLQNIFWSGSSAAELSIM